MMGWHGTILQRRLPRKRPILPRPNCLLRRPLFPATGGLALPFQSRQLLFHGSFRPVLDGMAAHTRTTQALECTVLMVEDSFKARLSGVAIRCLKTREGSHWPERCTNVRWQNSLEW